MIGSSWETKFWESPPLQKAMEQLMSFHQWNPYVGGKFLWNFHWQRDKSIKWYWNIGKSIFVHLAWWSLTVTSFQSSIFILVGIGLKQLPFPLAMWKINKMVKKPREIHISYPQEYNQHFSYSFSLPRSIFQLLYCVFENFPKIKNCITRTWGDLFPKREKFCWLYSWVKIIDLLIEISQTKVQKQWNLAPVVR